MLFIGTFDVQDGHVIVINEGVCFSATFAIGSNLGKILVTYSSRVKNYYNGNITIDRNVNATNCTTDIPSSVYSITFYNGLVVDDNNAAVIVHKTIFGWLPSLSYASTDVPSLSITLQLSPFSFSPLLTSYTS